MMHHKLKSITPHIAQRVATSIKLGGLVSLAVLVASCQTGFEGFNSGPRPSVPLQTGINQPLPAANGEIIGSGPIRVALLVPSSATGNASKVAVEIRNVAKMALNDIGQDKIQIVIKDTKGQAALASALAAEAVRENSQLILGPLLSANVSAAASIARPAGVPIIAFSTDVSVAQQGVYLNSFPPQLSANRVLSYAAAQGKRNIVAVLPSDAYGLAVEGELRNTALQKGLNVLQVAKYSPVGDSAATLESIQQAVLSLKDIAPQADAVFVPYFTAYSSAIVSAFSSNQVPIAGKQILGSGDWYGDNTHKPLEGGWFAQYDQGQFAAFLQRYAQTYGVEPGFNAGVAYDAVSLAIGLSMQNPTQPYSISQIENVNGFTGVTGLFRFNSQGIPQRGLAIYQYSTAGPRLIAPAQRDFTTAF